MTRGSPILDTVTLHVPFSVVKHGGRKEMQLPDGVQPDRKADNTLVKALARAFRWKRMLESGEFAADMQALGVSGVMPSRSELSTDRIGRHDAADREMLAAAKLAMDLVLPTERAGPRPLPMPDREEQWARRLFERAVGGFYRAVLPSGRWDVRTGRPLDWPIDWCTEGARDIMPGMRTDVVLDDLVAGRRIVIDTKFTGIVTAGWRREATLRSGYLYQI